MKKVYRAGLGLAVFASAFLYSCEKQLSVVSPDEHLTASAVNGNEVLEGEAAKVGLAKALVQALKEKEVRAFLKEEALKQYDGDYDVVFALVKDKKLSTGKTFGETLAKYAGNGSIKQWNNNAPLATIFVPNLKGFSPESWNLDTQVPDVVIDNSNLKNRDTTSFVAFSADLREYKVSTKVAPSFPVVVIKENERIVAKSKLTGGARKAATFVEQKSNRVINETSTHSFYFVGDVDPKQANKRNKARLTLWELPHILRWAYSNPDGDYTACHNNQPLASNLHRDWVYYADGYCSDLSRGAMQDYTEKLRGVKFNNTFAMQAATDNWSEGYLEFHLYVSFVHRNGGMQTDLKVFYCSPNDIRDEQGNPKEFNPDVELMPWDLYRYGDEWKLRLLEHDPGGSTSVTVSMSSTFGTNWEGNAGIDIKIFKLGGKFGGSQTFTMGGSQTISFNDVADQLGDARFLYDDPIITGTEWYPNTNYVGFRTYSVNTGAVELSIEPVAKSEDPRRL